jgi:hypothetical protein
MKIIPILTALGILAFSAAASAQDVVFVKPQVEPSARKRLVPKEPKIDEGSRTGGVIPRAMRSGNPLQLINPFAPAKYGNGTNMTDSAGPPGGTNGAQDDDTRPKTIKFFSMEF